MSDIYEIEKSLNIYKILLENKPVNQKEAQSRLWHARQLQADITRAASDITYAFEKELEQAPPCHDLI